MADSLSFVAGLDVFGITGWRLFNANPSDACRQALAESAFRCPTQLATPESSELAHLFLVTLGNEVTWNNTGPFVNVSDYPFYYSNSTLTGCHGPACPPSGFATWRLSSDGPHEFAYGDELTFPGIVWAVHDGDIAAVPEPETYALLLFGLAAIGLHGRSARKRRAVGGNN